MRPAPAFITLALALHSLAAQDAPKVVELKPANFACDVDAKKTAQLVVTFDREMAQAGFSFCGGGPKFPKVLGKPAWKDAKTIVVDIALEPDHDYEMSLNCQGGHAFRSAEGVELVPVPWSFSTLPAELPKAADQKKRNQQALTALFKTLDEHYSYRDLRVADWKKLEKDVTPALLAAPTDKCWATIAAHALAPTEDIHLHLRLGERVYPTGTRAVDSLYRDQLVAKVVTPVAEGFVRYGQTPDGFGYLMISTWGRELDLASVDRALVALKDTKALVIDARPNSGGDEVLAQKVAAWFVAGKKTYAKHRFRVRPGKDGFGPVIDRVVEGNTDPARRYDHPIAVLTSRYVMSSNESFVMMLRQAKECTTVGQPTFGSSGCPKPFELGNGVTAVVPSWRDLRLDGTCLEGEGIAPDVLVAATAADLEERDPILEKALEVLRGKVGK